MHCTVVREGTSDEPRPHVTHAENFMWFGRVGFEIYASGQTDRRENGNTSHASRGQNNIGVNVRPPANHLNISPSHQGRLSLLLSAGREMSTSQSAARLRRWGFKMQVWFIPPVDKRTCG